MNAYENLPCYPAYEPVNRSGKRAQWFEFERNYKRLVEIELMFMDELFNSEHDYMVLYYHYSKIWHNECADMKRHSKRVFKHTELNEHYFENIYKPRERWTLN